jgi:predicted HTH domain antitoxin
MAVQIDIPEDVLDSARLTVSELKVEIAVSLYAAGRLPVGKARALAGMNLWQFRQLLASRGIPPHFDEQDLLEDVQTLQDIGRL